MGNEITNVNQACTLSVKDITKSFGSNTVLKGVSVDLHAGDVLVLIGGNGAGKSTLMKIIMGIYRADSGEIFIDGKPVNMTNPSAALAAGVYMVPQEPMLFPNMTVEENILMGFRESALELKKRLSQHMEELGFKLNLQRKASTLSIAEQQLVEILRGMMREAKVLILDEPTSALTFGEVQSLFHVVEDLKSKGISMIYITHRLTEVFEIATDVAIMKDGVITLRGPVGQFTKEMLIRGLLPTDAEMHESARSAYVPVPYDRLRPVLEVRNLSGYGFRDISFDLYPGEILGIAGVVGAGRTELISTIFGRDKTLSGKVLLEGRDITGLPTKRILKEGINFVPEDRHYHGLFKIRSISSNTTSALLGSREIGRVNMNRKRQAEISQKYVDQFRTKIVSLEDLIGSLSGGNQQKVVIARSLSTNPKVVILDEPTRGIDAAARGDVYNIIHQLKDAGVAVLMVSSDIEEVVELADRAITVFHGCINGEFRHDEITQDVLTSASFGITQEKAVSE
ncbi:MAG: sugar ABC transporter ATP-binding protein [Oscillospiraceae bacterium]|nr:sugar ABC transporter ATP-binding protein [Oscillospiraceae bacterium]